MHQLGYLEIDLIFTAVNPFKIHAHICVNVSAVTKAS